MKVSKENREREVVTKVKDEVFVLELNHEEAAALMALVGSFSGDVNKDNPREHTDKIYAGLKRAGLNYFSDEHVQRYAAKITRGAQVNNGA